MERSIVAVVMAGGTGTRLYPASRSDRPKQFLSFGDERSLLERTVDQCSFADEIIVLTNQRYVGQVNEYTPGAEVLVEPEPKDTGPALAYAAHELRELLGDCVLICLPSDHHVGSGFEGAVLRAAGTAIETEGLVTMGVEPTRPAVGYGYIEPGTERNGHREVAAFHEKPDAETAAEYVEAGYCWNAGIFAWTPEAFLQAAANSSLAPVVDALAAGDPESGFEVVDPISVDHAVLEGAENAYVVPAGFQWDDLGSWDALGRVLDADEDGNVALGDVLAVDAEDTIVATDDAHVSVVGVEDLVVAAYDDRVLVVPRDESERIREVVEALREQNRF